MSKPGRKPKSPQLKLHQGNAGKRPIPELPDLAGLELEPPDFLSDRAKEQWMRHVAELKENDMVADLDRVRLALYFSAEARAVELDRMLQDPAKLEYVKAIDIQKELRQTNALLITMANNLGLTPTERARAGRVGKKKTDGQKLAEKYGV